ncbi:unnamed protein product [Zymoseptoria tritici ST99CH_1E4]|uniref:PLAC8 family protein n=1 Tax=Zymoseptoria tritici ST99CH_1E4 TaxID=1276532 RepID=A0A2H1GBX9_ZYMTR|nr:unnamed protein product [Zymoseptoria tritici ST99CH_1E4]
MDTSPSGPAPQSIMSVQEIREKKRKFPNEWQTGLFDHACFFGRPRLCLKASYCCCYLYGRTAQRLDHPETQYTGTVRRMVHPEFGQSRSEDCSYPCWEFFIGYIVGACLMVPCSWVLAMDMRLDIRKKYGLRGNHCTDCLAAFCCQPCTLAQLDEEVRKRNEAEQRKLTATSKQPAVQQQEMLYLPPHSQH